MILDLICTFVSPWFFLH